MVFGFRTTSIEDEKLVQLFHVSLPQAIPISPASFLIYQVLVEFDIANTIPPQGFELFSALLSSSSAAVLDLFPVLRRLPDALLPLRRYAKELHEKEKELYVGHWLNVKKV
jgi:hypothetical protein